MLSLAPRCFKELDCWVSMFIILLLAWSCPLKVSGESAIDSSDDKIRLHAFRNNWNCSNWANSIIKKKKKYLIFQLWDILMLVARLFIGEFQITNSYSKWVKCWNICLCYSTGMLCFYTSLICSIILSCPYFCKSFW